MRPGRSGTRLFSVALLTVMTFAFFAGEIAPVEADTVTTGGSSSTLQFGTGYARAFPITVPQSCVTSIGINWAGTEAGNIRVALYGGASGKPANLLTESVSAPMSTAAGWQDISVASYAATAGSYWVAMQNDAPKTIYYTAASRMFYVKSFGSFDPTWSVSSSSDSSYQINMRVTYTPGSGCGPDFSISASPTSQSVGAGSTALFTLNLAATGGFDEAVSLSVTSGCPSGVTCTVTGPVSSFPGSATLSVPTLITTSGSYSVVVHAQSTSKSHDVTATLSVTPPASYVFNVKSGATQIVVTLTYAWTGSGTPPAGSITLAAPGGSPTYAESGAAVYDRTSIGVSGTSNTYTLLHRVTFTVSGIISPQVWTALVSLASVSTYNITIEVS